MKNCDDIFTLSEKTTFAFSAENPNGEKNGGISGADCAKLSPTVHIKAGETAVIADIGGPGVIEHMWFTGYVGHSFILRIYWDDSENPSVEAPLSAFFACAYDENFTDRDGRYPVMNSAVMMVAPGRAYNSYFEMPFLKRCKITIENRSKNDYDLYYMITGCRRELPDNIGYFCASYRQEHPVTKGKSYTVIDKIKGKGRFLGVTLATGMNGNNTCWVEGEAKMFIDSDENPSVNYTGTEDYFCGSYGFGNDIETHRYQTYSGLYSGMFAVLGDSSAQYNSQQRFLLYRFHIKDSICFNENFMMKLDNLGWTGPRYDDYTSVAYWYQTLPTAPFKPLPADDEMIMR